MSARRTNEIFIAYESGHIEEARSRAAGGTTIVCFDFLVERELKKQNTLCVSLRDFVDAETGEEKWYVLAHRIAREWYRLPAMKFFAYDDIWIAEAPEPLMQAYLSRLFYYVRIYSALKKKYPGAYFSIPIPIVSGTPSPDCLTPLHPWAIIDAARMVGLQINTHGKRTVLTTYVFPRATWKTFLLRTYNVLVGFAPRRGFKVYSSAYWTHVVPIVEYLDDTEIMLFESTKFYRIPWRKIIKHRIRIFPSGGVISSPEEHETRRIAEKFREPWKAARREVAAYLAGVSGELNWDPVLEACDYLITYAPRIIADIRTLRRAMESEKPDLVLQMASVAGGRQHHFFLMARAAAQLKIPSLELQHASITIDPRVAGCRIETDYLATYGTDINLRHERLGHAPSRLIAVGSPRFDKYVNERVKEIEKGKQLFRQLGLDTARPTLLVAVPYSATFVTALDSYQLAEFYKTIRVIQNKIPGLQLLFKYRPDRGVNIMREFLQELFPDDSAIAADEDIFPLLCASDAVVCSNSTAIYQALLAGKPLVLYPWKVFDTYHVPVYAPAIPLVYTEQEAVDTIVRIFTDVSYRDELLMRQKTFLEGYSFDGKSSERVAALLHDIPRRFRAETPR